MTEGIKIRFRTIIEILGKPKEHIENTLRQYVEKIKDDAELMVMSEEFAEPVQKEEMWTAFVEMEIVANSVQKLIGFCFDYMPSSVEILKPEQFILKDKVIDDFLNDLQARLHKLDMVVKKLRIENDFIKKNMQTLIKNTIMICLTKNNLTLERLSNAAGVPSDELILFIEMLIKEKKIKKDGEIYSLIKNG